MTDRNLPEPILVKKPSQLRQMIDALQCEPVTAVDTESNSLYAYQEQVCLVQFSIPKADYLVDPLSLDDLSPMGVIFSNPQIEKVFHAAEYDVLCLKRDYGFEFANLFDTMAAARILGREAVGLGAILESEYGVVLDKRFQRANWGERPLPPDLLAYARLDTHYLIQLSRRLKATLIERDLWLLAQEDFNRLAMLNSHQSEDRSPDPWRISGANDLSPQQAAILHELCIWRDGQACKMNRPVFKVLTDETLMTIAQEKPSSLESLSRMPRIHPGNVRRYGDAILEAVECGESAPPLYPPRQARPSDAYLARLEALRQWRKVTAQHSSVGSDVILPRDLMLTLVEQNPHNQEELAEVLQAFPWRLEHYGAQILKVLQEA